MAGPTEPRIPPLPEAEWDAKARELLSLVGVPGAIATNIFTTLVRHPRLYRRFLAYGGVLLTGALPARDRELMILRTAARCGAEYEWGQHVRIATEGGVSAAEIAW
ncbi:MAG TPA: carboxymuconolactone decarboxylase family protein, partial [Acidimicrobiia bacterium]|nr:carboxymuconolactone decarboxylase family protein [Acidimicrobiia bacterium]